MGVVTHHLAIHDCVRLLRAAVLFLRLAAVVPDFWMWLWLRLRLWWLSQPVLFLSGLVGTVDLSDCHECRLIADLLRAVAAVAQSVLGEACCGFMSAKGSESNVMGGPGEPEIPWVPISIEAQARRPAIVSRAVSRDAGPRSQSLG